MKAILLLVVVNHMCNIGELMDSWDCGDKSIMMIASELMKYTWGCLRMARPFFSFLVLFGNQKRAHNLETQPYI